MHVAFVKIVSLWVHDGHSAQIGLYRFYIRFTPPQTLSQTSRSSLRFNRSLVSYRMSMSGACHQPRPMPRPSQTSGYPTPRSSNLCFAMPLARGSFGLCALGVLRNHLLSTTCRCALPVLFQDHLSDCCCGLLLIRLSAGILLPPEETMLSQRAPHLLRQTHKLPIRKGAVNGGLRENLIVRSRGRW